MADLHLTPELISSWKKEVSRLLEELKELHEDYLREMEKREGEVNKLRQRIEAASLLLGLEGEQGVVVGEIGGPTGPLEMRTGVPVPPSPASQEKIPDAIRRVISEQTRPITALELRAALAASGFEMKRLGKNAAYFYTCLKRLVKQGDVVKEGGKYAAPQAEEEEKEATG